MGHQGLTRRGPSKILRQTSIRNSQSSPTTMRNQHLENAFPRVGAGAGSFSLAVPHPRAPPTRPPHRTPLAGHGSLPCWCLPFMPPPQVSVLSPGVVPHMQGLGLTYLLIPYNIQMLSVLKRTDSVLKHRFYYSGMARPTEQKTAATEKTACYSQFL